MTRRRIDSECAMVHFEAIQTHTQALHSLDIGEENVRAAIMARKVYLTIAGDVAKRAGIRDEKSAIYKAAFPRSTQRHI